MMAWPCYMYADMRNTLERGQPFHNRTAQMPRRASASAPRSVAPTKEATSNLFITVLHLLLPDAGPQLSEEARTSLFTSPFLHSCGVNVLLDICQGARANQEWDAGWLWAEPNDMFLTRETPATQRAPSLVITTKRPLEPMPPETPVRTRWDSHYAPR